jgi:sugar lactone lactonase YvrE
MYRKNYLSLFLLLAVLLSCLIFTAESFAVPGRAKLTFKTPANHPTGLAFDGKNIWLADRGTHLLYQISPIDGTVITTIKAPGFDPRGLAWDGKLLWCVDAGEGWIYGINVQTGNAEKLLESNSPDPIGLAVDGEFLWLVDNKEKKLLKINRIDGMMHENIPAPSNNSKDLTFDGTYIWVADNGDDMLYRVDPSSGQVVTFLASVGPYPYGLCWDGTTLWCADYQKTEIYQLDLDDPDFVVKKDPKAYYWEAIHDFRNYGPDVVTDLDSYVAVPGDLDNQEIIETIQYDPMPENFVVDRWGQKFAHFHFKNIGPGSFLMPKMKVKAKLYHTEYIIFPERVGKLEAIPKELKAKYLADGLKYDMKNPIIQQAVQQAIGNERHPYWMVRKIFDYICDKIDYNLKPLGGWNPAPTVLKRGTGSCSEFTFIFIAMCRASGLPARYAGSIVVRSEDKGIDDVWHRWAEVYLPNYGWIPVDVSAGDSPIPSQRARKIGVLNNRYLITTKGGGDSEYLEFYYNFNAKWKTEGTCKVYSKQFGEFTPIDLP